MERIKMKANHFFQYMRIALKNKLWNIGMSFLLLFFAMPVYGMLYAENVRQMLRHDQSMLAVAAMNIYRQDVLGEGNVFLVLIVVFMAIAAGFSSFGYLYHRNMVDFYHSMPIRREQMFICNYLAGVICFAVPYGINLGLQLIIAAINGFLDPLGVTTGFIMLGIRLLGFLGIYTVTVLAILLTGKMTVGVLGLMVLLYYGPSWIMLINMLQNRFFLTHSPYSDSLYSTMFSPVSDYVNATNGIQSYIGNFMPDPLRLVIMVGFTVLFFGLCVLLVRKRPAEAAGQSMAFRSSMDVISILIMTLAALFGGYAFDGFAAGYRGFHSIWFILGIGSGTVLCHMLIQAIYYNDVKALLKNLYDPLIAFAAALLLGFSFVNDLFGYDRYLPEQYSSAAVASFGMQNYANCINYDAPEDYWGGRSIWLDRDRFRLEGMKITDKALIRDLILAAMEDTVLHDETVNKDADYDAASAYTEFTVRYNRDGRKPIYRRYTIDLLKHMDIYNRLMLNADYKEGVFAILTMPEDHMDHFRFANCMGEKDMKLSAEETEELIRIYQEELFALDAYTIRDSVPVGRIYRYFNLGSNGKDNFTEAENGYIYPSFTKTIAWLEKHGIDVMGYKDPENVSEIFVKDYLDFTREPEILSFTDKADIAAILAVADPTEMLYAEPNLHPLSDLEITVRYRDKQDAVVYGVHKDCMIGQFALG